MNVARPKPIQRHTKRARGEHGRQAARSHASERLGTSASILPDRDRARVEAQTVLWRVSSIERFRECKKVAVNAGGNVGVRAGNGTVGFSGLSTCGSVWACPECSARIAAQRADEVARAIEWCKGNNGEVAFGTFTVRHHRGNSLADVWAAVTAGWDAIQSDRPWKRDKALFGIIGWLKVIEVTHSPKSGFHVHIHCLFFLDKRVSLETVEALGGRLWQRWDRGLRRKGFESLRHDKDGNDVGVMMVRADEAQHLAGYFAKQTYEALGREVAYGGQKIARTYDGITSRSPMQILAGIVTMFDPTTGEIREGYEPDALERDLALWSEFEQASYSKKQMSWSRGLKKAAGVTEKTDEEIAEEDLGDVDLLLLPPDTWRSVRHIRWQIKAVVLEHGIAGLKAWLRGRGLEYIEPTRGEL